MDDVTNATMRGGSWAASHPLRPRCLLEVIMVGELSRVLHR